MTLYCQYASIDAVCQDRGNPVRRAIQNLVSRGLLEIRRGLGTFVLSPRIEAELTKLTGFVEDMKSVGRKATARVVSQGVVAATARVAERLQMAKGTKVMQIKRVRLADDTPISFDETYLPLPLENQIVRNNLRLHPIFTLLEEEYGVPLVEADYEVEAVIATKAVADALQVRVGSPIFQIERTSLTTGIGRLTMRYCLIEVISCASSRGFFVIRETRRELGRWFPEAIANRRGQ